MNHQRFRLLINRETSAPVPTSQNVASHCIANHLLDSVAHGAHSKLADGFYDLAISNVPFGDYSPFDSRFNKFRFPIHDYFFAASLEKVRPGGLVMFITSRGTMDKLDSTLREYLSTRTELLGAIRLPNDAFKRNAGTEVTTDIVMLRKLRPGESPTGPDWNEVADFENQRGEVLEINEYFATRPEMMLGQMTLTGRMYRDNEPTLEADDRELSDALTEAITRLPQAIYQAPKHSITHPKPEELIPAPRPTTAVWCLSRARRCWRRR